MYLCSIKLTNMETLLDILTYVGIALLAWILVMLVWVALRFAFSRKPFYQEWRKEVDGNAVHKCRRRSWFSMRYPEDEAWRKFPGFSSEAREKRKRWIEKQERKMYGC